MSEPFDIGEAMRALRRGYCVTRSDWTHGRYLYAVPGPKEWRSPPILMSAVPMGSLPSAEPYTPTTSDLMAQDWAIKGNPG